jgi:hypothetical protein
MAAHINRQGRETVISQLAGEILPVSTISTIHVQQQHAGTRPSAAAWIECALEVQPLGALDRYFLRLSRRGWFGWRLSRGSFRRYFGWNRFKDFPFWLRFCGRLIGRRRANVLVGRPITCDQKQGQYQQQRDSIYLHDETPLLAEYAVV